MFLAAAVHALGCAERSAQGKIQLSGQSRTPDTEERSSRSMCILIFLTHASGWPQRRHFQSKEVDGSDLLIINYVSGWRGKCLNHWKRCFRRNDQSRSTFIQRRCMAESEMWIHHNFYHIAEAPLVETSQFFYRLLLAATFCRRTYASDSSVNVQLRVEAYFRARPQYFAKL